jgi:hypothetical protein
MNSPTQDILQPQYFHNYPKNLLNRDPSHLDKIFGKRRIILTCNQMHETVIGNKY